MRVEIHPDAETELGTLPPGERDAMENAFEKLEVYGDRLGFPHSSKVAGTASLREPRPRAGRSPWRAFYRRIGEVLVIGAVGPEAVVDRQGFRQAIRIAEIRLAQREREGKGDD